MEATVSNSLLYERVPGSVHNSCLDILANLKSKSDQERYQILVDATQNHLKLLGVPEFIPLNYDQARELTNKIYENPDGLLKNLLETGKITEAQFVVLESLRLLVYTNTSYKAENVALFNERVSDARMLCSMRVDLTGEQKMLLIGAFSIAQSSNLYWTICYTNKSNPWNTALVEYVEGSTGPGAAERPKWADICGFILGFLTGGASAGGIGIGIALGEFASAVFE